MLDVINSKKIKQTGRKQGATGWWRRDCRIRMG